MKFISDIAVWSAPLAAGPQTFSTVPGIQKALAAPLTPPKNTLFVWKSVLVASMLLFSLTASPLTAGTQTNLTSENLLEILNQDRVQNGLPALAANSLLALAAEKKAEHILQNGYFAHTSPSGTEPWDFIRATGFDYSFAGENLAMNYSNAYELETDLLQSPSHRENLHSANFTQVGIAIASGLYRGQEAVVTVQMFGTPK